MSSARVGFWEPHTSSVDFCEPNYLHTEYVAETHNVWSSAFISLIAVMGMIYSNPNKDKRTVVMFLAQIVVGLGSMALHGTLNWFWQSADEVPMLWLNLTLLFSLYNVNSKKSTAFSAGLLVCIGFLQTVAYYTMRHVYGAFLFSFTATVLTVICGTAYHVFSDRNNADYPVKWWLYSRALFSYIGIAFFLWVYDMHHCESLLPYYHAAGGATFHIVWHIGAGVGAYLQILLMIAMRVQAQGNVAELEWALCGLLPVVKNAGSKSLLQTAGGNTANAGTHSHHLSDGFLCSSKQLQQQNQLAQSMMPCLKV